MRYVLFLFLHYTDPFVGYEVGGSRENVVKISNFWCFAMSIGDGVERSI